MTIKAAILDAQNKVIDMILLDSLAQYPGAIDALDGAIGDTWNGSAYIKPVVAVSVPQAVTRRQALQQLIIEGLDDDVEAVLASIPDITTRKLMTVWYRDSQVFERNRPEILQVWQALGRTPKQLDDTFIAASKL